MDDEALMWPWLCSIIASPSRSPDMGKVRLNLPPYFQKPKNFNSKSSNFTVSMLRLRLWTNLIPIVRKECSFREFLIQELRLCGTDPRMNASADATILTYAIQGSITTYPSYHHNIYFLFLTLKFISHHLFRKPLSCGSSALY